jgi:RNA polymerase sigma factor (sigma-70 family)
MTDVQTLLAEYVRSGSEAAFDELVTRYVDLVYSTAVRLVGGDTHLAEDVAQTVFVDLARTAGSLPEGVMIGGWLHRHTRFVASKALRSERRRQLRERKAAEMNDLPDHSQDNLARITPILDEAIDRLSTEDRTAILLRFFEQLDYQSVGEALGTNEVAAQKRVSRAVEQLRQLLAKRGVALGASVLPALLSTGAIQSAPIGLGAKISAAAALSSAALHNATTIGLTKTIAMTTIQKTMILSTLAIAVGASIYQTHRAMRLQTQLQSLDRQRAFLSDEAHALSREVHAATNALATLQQANDALREQTKEIPKLRGDLGRLRSQSEELEALKAAIVDDPTESAAKSWLGRVSQLRQALARMPDQEIPELRFLTDQDWLNAVKGKRQLATDADVEQALSNLRISAKNEFAMVLRNALRAYLLASSGQSPTDVSQLKPYFTSPVDNLVLQRYEFTEPGVIGQRHTPLDDQDDTYYRISVEDLSTISGDVAEKTLGPALQAFAAANHGQQPSDPTQLLPYVKTPAEQAVLQRVIQRSLAK